jgi:hypothetical protein
MTRYMARKHTRVRRLLHYAEIDGSGFALGPACGAEEGDWIPKGLAPSRPDEDVCLACIYAAECGVRVATVKLAN